MLKKYWREAPFMLRNENGQPLSAWRDTLRRETVSMQTLEKGFARARERHLYDCYLVIGNQTVASIRMKSVRLSNKIRQYWTVEPTRKYENRLTTIHKIVDFSLCNH